MAGKPRVRTKSWFEEQIVRIPESGCWIYYTKALLKTGYVDVSVNGKKQLAHRLSWEFYKGPIPDGAHICHQCDIPCCVNPNHLFLGDWKANMADKMLKGRAAKRLVPSQVMEIFTSIGSRKLLAEKFGVTEAMICEIKLGHSWGWLTGQ